MMDKMLNLMSENSQKMDYTLRETDRKFAELDNKISHRDFRLAYDAGNVPNSQSTNLQTKSGMMHTVHSTSVGMHGSSCECPECQRQGAQQLRQQNRNFLFDASNNNTPNSGAVPQPILSEKQTRRDFCEAAVNSNRPMKSGVHQLQTNSGVMQQIRSVSVGVHEPLPERIDCSRPNEQQTYAQPMRDHELLRNLTSQLNRQFS
ncbi:MAG: hypothetical protein GY820_03660, partial [Gammaproteobacteria bacterium]|nr:hypothetical protein [Gammaproteobacteria bacterium]